jgi:hypothetical protein
VLISGNDKKQVFQKIFHQLICKIFSEKITVSPKKGKLKENVTLSRLRGGGHRPDSEGSKS